jgi:gamma-glutamylcyclotransferase (GGCT)/AIG2-like uncharacterized protein YtfP
MYIYNVTTNIEESVANQWLQWMRDTHIPDMLATGKFLSAKICKVLVEEEMGGVTYAVQFTTPDWGTLQKYYEEDAPRLREDAMRRFKGRFVAFRTEMEVVGDHQVKSMPATQYLFTYGTLQEEAIQYAHFKRKLDGDHDVLPCYKISDEKVANAYPNVIYTGNPDDSVAGITYLLTNKELLKADAYEGQAYHRIEVEVSSGKKAWLYLSKINGD